MQHYIMRKMRLKKLQQGHCIKGPKMKDIDLFKNGGGCEFFKQNNIEEEERETLGDIMQRIKKNLKDIAIYLKNKDC